MKKTHEDAVQSYGSLGTYMTKKSKDSKKRLEEFRKDMDKKLSEDKIKVPTKKKKISIDDVIGIMDKNYTDVIDQIYEGSLDSGVKKYKDILKENSGLLRSMNNYYRSFTNNFRNQGESMEKYKNTMKNRASKTKEIAARANNSNRNVRAVEKNDQINETYDYLLEDSKIKSFFKKFKIGGKKAIKRAGSSGKNIYHSLRDKIKK